MEIIVHCPQCDYQLHLPHRDLLGRKGKCPKCEHKFIMEEHHARPPKPTHPPAPPEKSEPAATPKPQPAAPQPQKPTPQKSAPSTKKQPTDSSPVTPPTDLERSKDAKPAADDSEITENDAPTIVGVSVSPEDSATVPDDFWDEDPGEASILDPGLPSAGGTPGIIARCPHCHVAVDFRRDEELRDYHCGRCGKNFSLIHPEAPPDALTMPPKVGLYHLQKHPRIGVGPFGNVYRAKDGQSHEQIVIKVARGDQVSEAETEKFLATLRSAMQLKHKYIATLHEADRTGDRIYLVSSYISGVDLSEYLRGVPGRQLSPREAASLCALIASVLHHAHKFEVFHGNLKPSNIRLDGDLKPYLLDFGLNRRENGVLVTGNGRVVGSAAYLAPEQLPGTQREPDAQTDVFALGVIFYELLTGRRPFPGEGTEVFQRIARGGPAHPRSINPDVPKPLNTICMKCLEVDPRDRYETAMELYKELGLYLVDKPINTKPPGIFTRLGRWCRRRPVLAGVLFTFVFLAMAGAGFIGWRMWQQGGVS